MHLPITFVEFWLPIIISAIITLVLLVLYVVSYVHDRKIAVEQHKPKQFYGDSVPLIVAFMMVFMTIGITIYSLYLK